MNDLALQLYGPGDVRRIDARAIELLGVGGLGLMERAGAAAYAMLRRRWPGARRLCVVCGVGNNAGDGYIVARLAQADGLAVDVLQLDEPGRLRGDALAALEAYRGAGGRVGPFDAAALAAADVVVDAIVGTGLDRPLEGDWAAAVEAVNGAGKPVLAVDIPSGLHGATGAVLGCAVAASATITFIAGKSGLFTGAGPALVGELELARLDVPAAAFDGVAPQARLIDDARVRAALPRRPRDAHKGRYGHMLVIGGDLGMGGAARMAAEAAARVGAGLVSLATRAEHVPAVLAARPEIMCVGVADAAALAPLLARATSVVLGPGLGRSAWSRALFDAALAFGGPLLIDADGLNLLAEAPVRRDLWVLTPHPGEAARLLATSTDAVQADRFAAAERLAERYGGVAVLKGAGTVVATTGAVPAVCRSGNPGMASGGMGDVLSGVIGGLLAQGLTPLEAAVVGVHVHGMAADRAAAVGGERGLLAMDLMPHLRKLVNP